MDKLELDDRVNGLERRVSFITALMLVFMVISVVAAVFLLRSRAEIRPSSPTALPPPTEMSTVAATVLVHTYMRDVDAEIRKAEGLRSERLINDNDFAAKKAQIIARHLGVTDFKDDMAVAKKLKDDRLLTPDEYDVLKKKILELER
jgi:hypothetical protein